jgi:acyl-homoserine-lactone acylase
MAPDWPRNAVPVALVLALGAAACSAPPERSTYRALVRRTPGGIPHIKADDLGSIGFGTFYAMAEDNVCILADLLLTLGAQRAALLGPGDGNVDSDFVYQLFIDRGQAAEPLPAELDDVFRGAAAGYNQYLRDTGVDALPDPRCRGAVHVREVTALDVKRVSRFDYAFAYLRPLLTAAAPPDGAAAPPARAPDELRAAHAVAAFLELPKRGGSNAIALGREASRSGGGMLLANPHMPWDDPFQRFYPMHQTIPGRFDALGANLIGRPRVGFGHTEHVAWTSTVSTAKRTTFYQLALEPGNPTSYRFDGRVHPMVREQVTVRVKTPTGFEERSHTFYSTHFGALLVEGEFFPWTAERAYAVRMPDAGWRSELSVDAQYAARSVRELKAIHDRGQFLPVNLIAADRAGEVLYADPGPIPNLSDAQLEACAVMRGAAYDGSRSECQWGDDADAAAPGIIGPARLPSLVRADYVANSNDSYWLSNPAEPLEGFGRILGSEVTERTLRTRSGLDMLRRATEEGRRLALDDLQRLALANENPAGELLRDDLVSLCRAQPEAQLEDGRTVDLAPACEALAGWDLRADLDSRGAHVFRQFMSEANQGQYTRHLPRDLAIAAPFDPADPVGTPRGLETTGNPAALRTLAAAVESLRAAGIALDAPLGALQGVTRGGERIPLHGGPEYEGVFNKIEARFQGAAGYPDVTRSSSSWILAVAFDEAGPRSRGILTYSLSANPESPHHADQTRMFSEKRWLELPFREADVEAATLSRKLITTPR